MANCLRAIVKKHTRWDVRDEFDRITVHQEKNHTELTWSDSGVGEDYVMSAFRKEWPERTIEIDIDGGCDTCGYGRQLSVTISGSVPPWEGA